MNYQFQLCGDEIVCWNDNSNTWTPIAEVINLRQCKHLLRYAQLAEDVESLMDVFIHETSGIEPAVCPEVNDSDSVEAVKYEESLLRETLESIIFECEVNGMGHVSGSKIASMAQEALKASTKGHTSEAK